VAREGGLGVGGGGSQGGGDVLHDKDDPDARKPRFDKPAFCSAACREARRYETERERDRKRRPGKGKTE